MPAKKIIQELNIPSQCRKYGLGLWQCPQFLFLIMGAIIIGASLISYAIGTRYLTDPEMVALLVLIVSMVLTVIAFTVIRSFERLAEISRIKSEFISIVSHQIRSPLSNLKWATEVLMSGRLGKVEEKQTEYFEILKENSARMQELVSDLLTVSRIESATLLLQKSEVSLARLAEEVIGLCGPLAKASNVSVGFRAEQNLPKTTADPSQIKLVIGNILENAIRYVREKGEVQVAVRKTSGSVLLEVKDNGVGIPEKDQKYIFQKFFRSENALRYQTQGSGLGLYIAKAIVEKSGGKIGFESKEDKGSRFWFSLPIK